MGAMRMTSRELAGRIGRSESFVSKLIAGSRNPGIQTVIAISRALGWTTDQQLDEVQRGQYGAALLRQLTTGRDG